MTQRNKGRQWDGRSRIPTDTYKNNWNDIFGKKNVMTEEEWTNKLLNKKKNGTTKKVNRTAD